MSFPEGANTLLCRNQGFKTISILAFSGLNSRMCEVSGHLGLQNLFQTGANFWDAPSS